MLIAEKAVKHGEQHHAVMDEASIETAYEIIQDRIAEFERTSASIEAELRTEFDEVFAEDLARAKAALKLLDEPSIPPEVVAGC